MKKKNKIAKDLFSKKYKPRIIKPKKGTVTIDKINIHENINDYWRILGYVPQNSYLMHGTLAWNITYKKTYTRTLILSNSILISVLICYWKFRTENSSSFEMMGVTGGILQIASMFNIFSGRIILFLIKKFINTKIYCDSNNILHHDEPCV